MKSRNSKAKHLLIGSGVGLLAVVTLCGGIRHSRAAELPQQQSSSPPIQQVQQVQHVQHRIPSRPPKQKDPSRPAASETAAPPSTLSSAEAAPPLPPETTAEPETAYDYTAPVPQSPAVEKSYFDDAVFIGDSLTEELILTTSLSNTTVYAYKGLMVDTAFTKAVIRQGGQKVSVMDALAATDFAKVYIMFGINETGWVYSNIFQEKYGAIIDRIREINPDAVIYIQSILPVSQSVSSTHSYITNDRIDEYNGLLRQLAEEKQVYYVDVRQAVMGEDGALPEDAAPDGIHPVRAYCEQWLSYLQEHTV